MKFACKLRHRTSGELREMVVELSKMYLAFADSVRKRVGSTMSDLLAQTYAMSEVYRELSPHEWRQVGVPQRISKGERRDAI